MLISSYADKWTTKVSLGRPTRIVGRPADTVQEVFLQGEPLGSVETVRAGWGHKRMWAFVVATQHKVTATDSFFETRAEAVRALIDAVLSARAARWGYSE